MMNNSNSPPLYASSPMVRDVIYEQAGTPSAEILLAGFVDSCVSQAVGPCVQVKSPRGDTEQSLGFFTMFGPPASAKTPMSALFWDHFNNLVQAYDNETAEAWQEYTGKEDAWKAKKSGILKSIKKNASLGHLTNDLELRLIELEKRIPQMPPSPPRRLENFTLSAWIKHAVLNPVTLLQADEGGAMLASMEKDLIGALCSFYSGMSLSHARGHMGVQVVRALPTFILSIQTSVFISFLASSKGKFYIDSGMAGRSLYYGVHETDFAQQLFSPCEERPMKALQVVLDRSEYFFHTQVEMNKNGWKDPKVLELSQAGKREFQDSERYLHRIRRDAASPGELTVIDKASHNILRHAARHHEFAGIDGPIEASEISDSTEWILWSLDNYVALTEHGQTSGHSVEKDANALWDMMLRLRVRDPKVTKRRLREEAFNIGLVRSGHFNLALSALCQEKRATVKNGYVYWDRPDRWGHLLC